MQPGTIGRLARQAITTVTITTITTTIEIAIGRTYLVISGS